MNFVDVLCVSCAGNLQNAASYIVIHAPGQESVPFNERGYEAITAFAAAFDRAKSQSPNAWVQMNGLKLAGDLHAVTMVNGDAVCAAHVWDAIERGRMYGRR